MKYLAKDPLLFEPGESWRYSLCHDVLAAFVEVLTGEKFEDYIRKTVFDAADMPHSTFLLPEEELGTIAAQYSYTDGKAVNIGPNIHKYKIGSEYASGGAGAISTVEDYIRFLECLRTGMFLKPETIDLMRTNRLTKAQRERWQEQLKTNGTHGYGLGIRTPGIHPSYTDYGWGGAAGAFLAVEPERQMTLYFGTHMLSSPFKKYRPLLFRLAKAEMFEPDDLPGARAEIARLREQP